MVDKVKDMLQKLIEFWNKYSAKQKAIIISVIVTILLAIGILAFSLTRTTYTHLRGDKKIEQETVANKIRIS